VIDRPPLTEVIAMSPMNPTPMTTMTERPRRPTPVPTTAADQRPCMIDRIWPVGEPADMRVVEVRDDGMNIAWALVLAARLDRNDLGHHLGRHLLGQHGVGVVVVVGDALRNR
jgi:hypothetical protein